jgi:hypothetical protein
MLISQQSEGNLPAVVLTAVRQDLSRRTKIAPNQFKIVQSTPKTWPDGCLGLATSDEICTQALVEGWRVIMTYKQHTWTYRTDNQGLIIRLESKR